MRTTGIVLKLAATMIVFALPAFADSLEAKKMHAQQEADLTDKLALTNQRCGSHVKAAIDWSTFSEPDVLKTAVTPFCAAVRVEIRGAIAPRSRPLLTGSFRDSRAPAACSGWEPG